MNFKRTYGLDPWARQKKTIWEIHNKHITVFHALHPNEGCPSFKSSTQYGCNMNPPLNAACHSFQRFSLLQNPTPFNLGTPHPSEESSFNEVTVAPTPPWRLKTLQMCHESLGGFYCWTECFMSWLWIVETDDALFLNRSTFRFLPFPNTCGWLMGFADAAQLYPMTFSKLQMGNLQNVCRVNSTIWSEAPRKCLLSPCISSLSKSGFLTWTTSLLREISERDRCPLMIHLRYLVSYVSSVPIRRCSKLGASSRSKKHRFAALHHVLYQFSINIMDLGH